MTAMRRVLGVVVLPLFTAVQVPAQTNVGVSKAVPVVSVAPVIDGDLTDRAWNKALQFSAFKSLRPEFDRAPAQATDVLISSDREQLYIAIRCDDSQPQRARAQNEREVFDDDWVLFALDSYGDGLAAYFVGVNANGKRMDGTLSWEGRPDVTLNFSWQSATRRSATGYVVELAIPFAALSHPWQQRGDMGFKVARYIQRSDQEVNFPLARPDRGPPLTQFQRVTLNALTPSSIAADTMIAMPNVAANQRVNAATDTLEGRRQAWGEVDVSDHLLFPHDDIPRSTTPFHFPVQLREPMVRTVLASLAFRDGFPIRDIDSFLTRTASTSLLIVAEGAVIYERYYNRHQRDSIMTSFSVAKSFVSTLVGRAIEQGKINAVHDPVTRYVPELAKRDMRFAAITLEHLLSMSSGLRYHDAAPHWDDAVTYYHPRLRDAALHHSTIEQRPGRHFLYNNYNPLLMGVVLERATNMPVPRYLAQQLWEQLGMEYAGSWSLDSESSGFAKMESGINARAIDYAKLGQLYLQQGRWRDQQVLSPTWIAAATQPREHTMDYYPPSRLLRANAGYYGWYWWGRQRGNGPHDFYALGNKGQFIYVAPQANMVIVRTGIEYGIPAADWIELFHTFASRYRGSAK